MFTVRRLTLARPRVRVEGPAGDCRPCRSCLSVPRLTDPQRQPELTTMQHPWQITRRAVEGGRRVRGCRPVRLAVARLGRRHQAELAADDGLHRHGHAEPRPVGRLPRAGHAGAGGLRRGHHAPQRRQEARGRVLRQAGRGSAAAARPTTISARSSTARTSTPSASPRRTTGTPSSPWRPCAPARTSTARSR